MNNDDGTKSGGMSSGSQTEHAMDHDLNDGAGFGAHVSEMAQKSSKHGMDKKGFSGEMNPGKHDQGYSGLKMDK